MPSNRQRFFAVVATAAITFSGAWLASQVPLSESSTAAVAEAPGNLEGLSVQITGLRNATGRVIIVVFDDEAAFEADDDSRAAGYQEIEASRVPLDVAFPELKAGPYAVTVFHDENGDRDWNLEGEIPLEGYAVSGAVDDYDDPGFQRAAVAAGAIQLRLHYYK